MQRIYFVDEATFSSRLNERTVYALADGPVPTQDFSKIGFKCVAATAAIDRDGRLVAVH